MLSAPEHLCADVATTTAFSAQFAVSLEALPYPHRGGKSSQYPGGRTVAPGGCGTASGVRRQPNYTWSVSKTPNNCCAKSSMKLEEIAEMSGCQKDNSFWVVFKKSAGVSPEQYQKQSFCASGIHLSENHENIRAAASRSQITFQPIGILSNLIRPPLRPASADPDGPVGRFRAGGFFSHFLCRKPD